jgi:hypothetical protein
MRRRRRRRRGSCASVLMAYSRGRRGGRRSGRRACRSQGWEKAARVFDAKKGTHIGTLDDSEAKDIFGLFGAPASVLSEEQAAKRRQRLAEAHDRLAGARSAAAAHSRCTWRGPHNRTQPLARGSHRHRRGAWVCFEPARRGSVGHPLVQPGRRGFALAKAARAWAAAPPVPVCSQ